MRLHRRTILRGAFQGATVSVAMPFLDCFLDSKGQALAATGKRIPTRFNTFFFGLGLTNALWIPKTAGKDYESPPLLKRLDAYKAKMNVFTGLQVPLDGKPNQQHFSGVAACTTGISPSKGGEFEAKTLDLVLADVIGRGARLKTVSVSCSGNRGESYSSLGGANAIPPEISPTGLYTRLFGPGFQDPSSGDWKPDPALLLQQSVLTAIGENRKDAMKNLGPADKARMDQFFTSLREAEQQIAAQQQRPEVIAEVRIPEAPAEMPVNKSVLTLQKVVPVLAKLAALGLATDQTRVMNITLSEAGSTIYRPGDPLPFHQATHEEAVDPALGYQKRVAEFDKYTMEFFDHVLKEMDAIQEGDGTLLDHSLLLSYSDTSFAKIHALDGIPVFLIGGANGRMKTGYHIAAGGQPISRVGLTIQKAFGLPVDKWGQASLETSNPFTELLA